MTEMTQNQNNTLWRKMPALVILLVAVVGAFFLRDYLSFEALAQNREALVAFRDANFVLTAVGFVLAYVLIVGFSLPGASIATLTGGFLFGIFPGVFLNVLGATLGAMIIFGAVRAGFGERLTARMDASSGPAKRIKMGIDNNQWSMLLLIRLVPIVPFFVANILPALFGVTLWRFTVTTFFGILPGGLVFTSIGSGLSEVFARGETPNLGIIFEPQILLPILGLALLSLVPVVVKFFKGRVE